MGSGSPIFGEKRKKNGRAKRRACPSLNGGSRKTLRPADHRRSHRKRRKDLPEWHVLTQAWQTNGATQVGVIATTTQAPGPPCQNMDVKIPEIRARKRRDVALRGHPGELIRDNRRFRCWSYKRRFPEPDHACGSKRRTTQRLREAPGTHASTQPVARASGVRHYVGQP